MAFQAERFVQLKCLLEMTPQQLKVLREEAKLASLPAYMQGDTP
ncbi:hypothetical protein EJP617_30440 [Erwinia sp. Ejp617]|nr:hypothetical protein [Erwinia sp. Ejp617]ADP12725.1 hypothetical protein EJP617_30440 [Erwinia sp. Ejp617]